MERDEMNTEIKQVVLEIPAYLEDVMQKFAERIRNADVYADDMLDYFKTDVIHNIIDVEDRKRCRDNRAENERKRKELNAKMRASGIKMTNEDIEYIKSLRGAKLE